MAFYNPSSILALAKNFESFCDLFQERNSLQGFVVRRQLQHKQKEMLNLMIEQQQRQVQCLEMLKMHHFQSKNQEIENGSQIEENGIQNFMPSLGKEKHCFDHEDNIVDLTINKTQPLEGEKLPSEELVSEL